MAESPPPTTTSSFSLKKAPSHVAQADRPRPWKCRSRVSVMAVLVERSLHLIKRIRPEGRSRPGLGAARAGERKPVAGSITWERLRELAAFRASRGRAISLYLDLDPSVAPTAGDVQ